MRHPTGLIPALAIALSACATTEGSAYGWAGGPPPDATVEVADRHRTPRSRPRIAENARPIPPPRPRPMPAAAPTSSGLLIPVEGVDPGDLRDSFHSPRSGGRTHHAIDIGAPLGTPVLAVADGTVSRMHWNALGGRTLYLTDGQHDYYYAHLDSYADDLEIGKRVSRGDELGTVGQTGNARSPHLHFQVLARNGGGRGTPINPYDLLRRAETASAR
jgi:murein DD-endopeptidase MepM/ murein hydrolase activator NlpD